MYRFMSTHNRWMMIILVLMLVSATVQMVSAAGEVTWYWKDADVSGFTLPSSGHQSDKFMNTSEAPQGDTSYTVTLGKGERAWWYVNYPAECNLTFPDGNWKVIFWVNATNSTDNEATITIRLQGINSTGYQISGTTGYKGGTYTIKNATNIEKIEKTLSADSINMSEGDRIAVEVLWFGSANGTLLVYYNSTTCNSTLTSPPNSPVWPVPELPTIILFSAGLLILAGYAYMDRRNK